MNWVVFAIAAWVTLGLEFGLRDALQLGAVNIAPHFAVILLVFVTLWSSQSAALAAGLLLGVALDLFYQVPLSDASSVVVLGPHALGCMLAAYAVLNMRALMFRKNVLAIAFLSFVAAALMQVVVTAVLAVRGSYDMVEFGSAASELGQRLASAVYTGVVALAYGAVLGLFRRFFDFQSSRAGGFRIQ